MDHVDVGSTTHEANEKEYWTQNTEGLEMECSCIPKQETEVNSLKSCQDPNLFNLYKVQGAPRKENADLVHNIQNDKIVFDPGLSQFVWMQGFDLVIHNISKTCDYHILKEVYQEQI